MLHSKGKLENWYLETESSSEEMKFANWQIEKSSQARRVTLVAIIQNNTVLFQIHTEIGFFSISF